METFLLQFVIALGCPQLMIYPRLVFVGQSYQILVISILVLASCLEPSQPDTITLSIFLLDSSSVLVLLSVLKLRLWVNLVFALT